MHLSRCFPKPFIKRTVFQQSYPSQKTLLFIGVELLEKHHSKVASKTTFTTKIRRKKHRLKCHNHYFCSIIFPSQSSQSYLWKKLPVLVDRQSLAICSWESLWLGNFGSAAIKVNRFKSATLNLKIHLHHRPDGIHFWNTHALEQITVNLYVILVKMVRTLLTWKFLYLYFKWLLEAVEMRK